MEDLVTEVEEARRANVLGGSIGNDVGRTLVLRTNLKCATGPPDVVVLKCNMARFRWYQWSCCKFDGRGIVFEHGGRVRLWVTEVFGELTKVN